MKIIIKQLPKSTIEDFADEHNLTMIVTERNNSGRSLARYYAHFLDAEDKESKSASVIGNSYGEGESPDEAIRRYAHNISGKLLVIKALSNAERKEIQCPIFIR